MPATRLAIFGPVLLVCSQALAQANPAVCFDQEEQLLNDVGVLRDDIMGAPVTAEQLLKTEAFVTSERLSRSGVQYIERKKSMALGPPGLSNIAQLSRVVEVPGNANCDGIQFLKPLDPEEAAQLMSEHGMPPEMLAEFMDQYSKGALMLGAVAEQKMPGGMDDESIGMVVDDVNNGCALIQQQVTAHGYSDSVAVGRPLGATEANIDPMNPGSMFSPLVFMSGPACMARMVADHLNTYGPESDSASAAQQAEGLNNAIATVGYSGMDHFSTGPAYHLIATGLNHSQLSDDGVRMTINEMHAWIDAERMARKKMRFAGVMEQDKQSRDFFMEIEFDDFRKVPGSLLIEPYREILRMGGVLGPKEQAEMAEAREKLAEFEKQMASMPASQRAMMENMMGGQLAQMRNMVNGGAVEFEIITSEIRINPEFNSGGPSIMDGLHDKNLVQVIQEHLVALGYDPGNTDGVLSKATVVAITKFEAANGMPVTGQATPQLAGVLAAAVDAQR